MTRALRRELERLPKVTGTSEAANQIYVTGRLNRILAEAEIEAKKLRDEYVSVEHLLLVLPEAAGACGRIFKRIKIES